MNYNFSLATVQHTLAKPWSHKSLTQYTCVFC